MKEYFDMIMKKLFCLHDWKAWKEVDIYSGNELPRYTIYHFHCKKCGKFKSVKSN